MGEILDKYSQQLIMNLYTPAPKPQQQNKPTVEPKHVELSNPVMDYDVMSANFIQEIGGMYNKYLKLKRQEGHSQAWEDTVNPNQGARPVNLEMQLELSRIVRQNNPQFYREAGDYANRVITAFMERSKPFSKRYHRKGRHPFRGKTPKGIFRGVSQKRANLIDFGFAAETVDKVIKASLGQGSTTVEAHYDKPEDLDNIKTGFLDNGMLIDSETIKKKDHDTITAQVTILKMQKGLYEEPKHQRKEIEQTKIGILGFPSKKRTDLAVKLSRYYGVPHITLKELISLNIGWGTVDAYVLNNAEGDQLNEYADEMFGALNERLDGFVLEGYPFAENQLGKAAPALDAIAFVDFPIDDFVEFQGQKRWCPACMAMYHLELHPPVTEDACSRCGSRLISRPFDKPSVITDKYYSWRGGMNEVLARFKELHKLIDIPTDVMGEDVKSLVESALTKWRVRLD